MASDLAIEDISKRLSLVETQYQEKVAGLEKEIQTLKIQLEASLVHPESPVKDLPCFAKYKRPDGRILTSSMAKDTKEWYESGLCEFNRVNPP